MTYSSPQPAWLARLCRMLPPALATRVLKRFYPPDVAKRYGAPFSASSSLARGIIDCPGGDYTMFLFAMRGYVDWQTVAIANFLCRRGDTIIEVGAHIGTETVPYARVVGDSGVLAAFEPVPANFEALKTNVERNRLSQVKPFHAAASDRDGTARFSTAWSDFSTVGGRIVADGAEAAADSYIQVQAVTLDRLVREGRIPPPRMLIMDAEGAEFSILNGARQLIEAARPFIVCEINPPKLRLNGLSWQDISRLLEGYGYRLYRVTGMGLKPVAELTCDVLAIPDGDSDAGRRTARRIHRKLFRAALLPLIPYINPAVVP